MSPNTRLFDRYYELHIANRKMSIDDIDIFFRVKGKVNEATTAEITLFNLSETTKSSIKTGSPVVLIAGYRNDYGVIFQGTVKRAELSIEGADVATEITAVDNLANLNQKIKILVPAGTDYGDIARQIFQQVGLPVGAVEATGHSISRPFTFSELAILNIKQIADETGYIYYIKDGKAFFVRKNNVAEQINLSSGSGLLEVTKVEDESESDYSNYSDGSNESDGKVEKYKVKSLMIWRAGLDSRINLESIKEVKGNFKVIAYEHACLQDEYYSELEVVPVE